MDLTIGIDLYQVHEYLFSYPFVQTVLPLFSTSCPYDVYINEKVQLIWHSVKYAIFPYIYSSMK